MDIKIKIYGDKVFEIDNRIISNADSLDFSEDINSGQSGIDIDLLVDFDNTDYSIGGLVEYSIYNEDYKNGLLKYSGVITKIKRSYEGKKQGITLETESVTYLLSQKQINKNYTGTYQSIVDDIINDLGDNTCNMNFLGNQIFKNEVQNIATTSITINGNLLEALQKLFENKTFFINQYGEIKDTFAKKHKIKFGRDIFSNSTEENSTGITNVELEVKTSHDINVGDYIKIINTDTFLNLDNKQITKLDFALHRKKIIIGEISEIKVI